jgi:hypothetical protein
MKATGSWTTRRGSKPPLREPELTCKKFYPPGIEQAYGGGHYLALIPKFPVSIIGARDRDRLCYFLKSGSRPASASGFFGDAALGSRP